MAELLKTKTVSIADIDGKEREFILSRFSATVGREVFAKYAINAVPKLGEYTSNEEMMYRMMQYVGVKLGDSIQTLSTQALVDNHTGDAETLVKLEWEMLRHNFSFFQNGSLSNYLENLAQMFLVKLSQMLTPSLDQ